MLELRSSFDSLREFDSHDAQELRQDRFRDFFAIIRWGKRHPVQQNSVLYRLLITLSRAPEGTSTLCESSPKDTVCPR